MVLKFFWLNCPVCRVSIFFLLCAELDVRSWPFVLYFSLSRQGLHDDRGVWSSASLSRRRCAHRIWLFFRSLPRLFLHIFPRILLSCVCVLMQSLRAILSSLVVCAKLHELGFCPSVGITTGTPLSVVSVCLKGCFLYGANFVHIWCVFSFPHMLVLWSRVCFRILIVCGVCVCFFLPPFQARRFAVWSDRADRVASTQCWATSSISARV